MASLGSLFVNFEADTSKWTAGVNQVLRDSKELEKQIKGTTKVFTEIGAIMSGIGVAIVGTLTAAAKSAANYGDAIRDASIRTGLTTEALSGLKFAAEQSGTSFEGLQTGLRRFSTNVAEAANGTKAQIKLFRDLGVSVKDSAGQIRPVEDLLGDVADAFNKMPEGVTKAATAIKLFGKTGTDLTELLSSGKIGLEEFRKEAERLGLVIGQDTADQADKFNDSLNAMSGALKGLEIVVGNAILPALTSLSVKVTDIIADFNQFAKAHSGLIDVAFKLGAVLGTGGALFLGVAGLLVILPKVALAWNALTVAMAANPFGLLAVAITTALVAIIAFRKEISEGLATAFDKLAKIGIGIPGLVSAPRLAEWAKALRESKTVIDDYGPSMQQLLKGFGGAAPVIDAANDAAKKLMETFKASLKPADDLNKDLVILMKQFSNQEIISVYGKRITDAAEAQRKHGFEVRGATAELEKQIIAMNQWAAQLIVMNNAARTIPSPIAVDLPILQPGQIPELQKLPPIRIPVKLDDIKIDTGAFGDLKEATDRASTRLVNLSEKIRQLQAANVPAQRIMALYGSEIQSVTSDAEKLGLQIPENIQQFDKLIDAQKRGADQAKQFQNAMSTAFGQIAVDFAKAVTQVELHGGNLVKKLKGIGQAAGESFLTAFNLQVFAPLQKLFMDLGTKLADILTNTLFKPLDTLIDKIGDKLEKTLTSKITDKLVDKIPGFGGTADKATQTAASTATGAAGSVAGSAAGSLAGGIAQTIMTGLSILQQKRVEGTMNAVEFNTRASMIHLSVIIDQLLWPIKFSVDNILTFAGEQVNQLDAIYNRLTPGVAIPALASGGFMTQTGLILAHAGETVSSRSQSNNIVMNLNLNIEGADVRDPRQFATQIMENIDREIMSGNRGWLQRWGTQFSHTAGNTTSSPRANR